MVESDMTALWEATMTEIEAGNERLDDFVFDVAGMTREIISDPLRLPSDIPGLPRKKRCMTDGCDGYLNHVQREGKRPFFSCPLCRKTFNDTSGEPVPRKEYTEPVIEAACPMRCGRQARRYKSEYGYYWRCDCSPDETFRDVDGQPASPVERARASCPVMGCKGTAVRFQARVGDRLFWKCSKCGNFFDDSDGVPVIREKKGKHAAGRKRG
jgi:transposase-like protein